MTMMSVAEAWGKAVAQAESVGRPMSAMDAFLAATAGFITSR
jgi:hypothetical protein